MARFRAFRVEKTEDRRFPRRVMERDTADLPPGDLLIEVAYSSLNYKDALSATGNPGVTRNFPHTPGIDAAGTVLESASDAFAPGDAVIASGYDLGMNTGGRLRAADPHSGRVGGPDAGQPRRQVQHDPRHGRLHGGTLRA